MNSRILIVDESRKFHDQFSRAVSRWSPGRFHLDYALREEEALGRTRQALKRSQPYAVAMVDGRVTTNLQGLETIRRLWEVDVRLQAMLCATECEAPADEAIADLANPGALVILKKPVTPTEARLAVEAVSRKWTAGGTAVAEFRRLKTHSVDMRRVVKILRDSHRSLESAHATAKSQADQISRLMRQHVAETEANRDTTVMVLAKLAESRHQETGEHLQRMQRYTRILAARLAERGPHAAQIDRRFLEEIDRASPLHDVGKVAIADAILTKPGPLTSDEFDVMKRHTIIGAHTLAQVASSTVSDGFLAMAVQIARSHHERFDGGGYPDGLQAEQIPLAARIVAVADVFDAVTSVRVYKDAIAPEIARRLIDQERGRQFDPAVVDAFQDSWSDFLEVQQGSLPRSLVVCSD